MAVRHVAAGGVESLQVPKENLEVVNCLIPTQMILRSTSLPEFCHRICRQVNPHCQGGWGAVLAMAKKREEDAGRLTSKKNIYYDFLPMTLASTPTAEEVAPTSSSSV